MLTGTYLDVTSFAGNSPETATVGSIPRISWTRWVVSGSRLPGRVSLHPGSEVLLTSGARASGDQSGGTAAAQYVRRRRFPEAMSAYTMSPFGAAANFTGAPISVPNGGSSGRRTSLPVELNRIVQILWLT